MEGAVDGVLMDDETDACGETLNAEVLLDRSLFGCSVHRSFAGPEGSIEAWHQFSWTSLLCDPKGDHGEVVMDRGDEGLFLKVKRPLGMYMCV